MNDDGSDPAVFLEHMRIPANMIADSGVVITVSAITQRTHTTLYLFHQQFFTALSWSAKLVTPSSESLITRARNMQHNRAVTKRWAEQLRFQRADRTAGFMLFSNEWHDLCSAVPPLTAGSPFFHPLLLEQHDLE